jgi:ABC-type transport system involved in cytochrome c biogenesis ATPase subunit
MTGWPHARAGEALTRGLTIAIDELNAAGGVLVLTSHQDIPIAAPDARAIELQG